MIFDNCVFLNESTNRKTSMDTIVDSILSEGAVISGTLINDCRAFLTETMILECSNDRDLIYQNCLLEGAKFDMTMKNFMKEGEDFKGLKKELKEIMKMNDMDDSELQSNVNSPAHVVLRILQILEDLCVVYSIGVGGTQIILSGFNPIILIGSIIGFAIGFLINRVFRFLWDSIHFNVIKKDCENIVLQLRKMSKDTKDSKLQKKYSDEADRLEAAIEKYSAKRNEKEKKSKK